MTNGFTAETKTTTRTERTFRVPTGEDGADYGQVAAASGAAWAEYREKMGLPEGADMPPGVIRFQSGDGHVVTSWTVEEVA